jgi:hypothetical protein
LKSEFHLDINGALFRVPVHEAVGSYFARVLRCLLRRALSHIFATLLNVCNSWRGSTP